MNDSIPSLQFDVEVALVRRLVQRPPWLRTDGNIDQGIRAPFKRWTPRVVAGTPDDRPRHEPSVEMTRWLWSPPDAKHRPYTPDGWADHERDRAVRHAALVLHLVALSADGGRTDRAASGSVLGRALAAADVADARFVRLMHTPPPARMEALGRAVRRLRTAGILYAPAADPDDAAGRSTRRTLERHDRDDLAALLQFLFQPTADRAIARWAGAFFDRKTDPTSPTSTASEDA